MEERLGMREFDAFTTTTAIMASYFSFASTVSGWMTRNGVTPENARTYVGEMLRGMAATSLTVVNDIPRLPHRKWVLGVISIHTSRAWL